MGEYIIQWNYLLNDIEKLQYNTEWRKSNTRIQESQIRESQNLSMKVEIKMVVTLGTDWEGHKEMSHILIQVLATQVCVKIY